MARRATKDTYAIERLGENMEGRVLIKAGDLIPEHLEIVEEEHAEEVEHTDESGVTQTAGSYDSMTVAQLRELAQRRNVTVDEHAKKAELIDALRAASE